MAGNIAGVTIEFDSDTTGISRGIKKIESESNALQKQINAVNKNLKFDAGNVELAAQKMDLLAQSAASAGKDVSNLRDLQSQMDAAGVEKSSEAYRKLEQEIAIAESKQQRFAKQFQDSLKTAPIEQLERQFKLLEDDIKASDKEVENLEKQLEAMDAAGVDHASAEYKQLSQELEAAKTKNQSLRESLEQIGQAKGAREAGEQVEDLGDALEDAADNAEGAGDSLGNVENGLSSISSVLVGAGLLKAFKEFGSALKDCIGTSADFDSAMSQVAATMGTSVDSIRDIEAAAKEMGSSTQFSATEAAEALNYLALAGYDSETAIETLPTVLNLAAAGSFSLASASDMVTDAMSALGLETSYADTMVDQMAKTASTTNTSVEQLGEAMLTIGATGKSVAGGTAELNTELGILANVGIKGSEAGTHLRNVILSLQNPTKEGAAALGEYTNGVYDAQGQMRGLGEVLGELAESMRDMDEATRDATINDIFNKTDLASAKALLDATGEGWDNLTAAIKNSSGAAEEMANTQMDNLNGSITELKSATEGLQIAIGQQLSPAMVGMTDAATGAVQKITEFVSQNEGAVPVIVGVTTALGGMATAVTALAAAQKIYNELKTMTAFAQLLTPIGAVTTAIGALAAGIIVATGEWQRIQAQQERAASESAVAAKAYEETSAGIAASQERVGELTARLEELTSATELSAAEQEEAKGIVAELNDLVPDLGLTYDEATNSINMNTDAIIRNAKAAGNQQEITALQEKMAATSQEQRDIEQDLADAKADLAESTREYNEALAAQAANTDKSVAAQTEYADAVNDAKAAMEADQDTVNQTQAYYDELGASIEADAEKVLELSGKTKEATEETKGMGKTAKKTAEELEEEAAAAEEATKAIAQVGLEAYNATGSGDELMARYKELSKTFENNADKCDESTRALAENALQQLKLTAMTEQLREQLPLLGEGYEGLASAIDRAGYSVEEFVADYQKTFSSLTSGFDELKYNTEQGLDDWVAAMDKRVEIQEKWNANMATLVDGVTNASTHPYLSAIPAYKQAVQTMMDGGMETYGKAAEELAAAVESGNVEAITKVCNGIIEAGEAANAAAIQEFAMATGLTVETIQQMIKDEALAFENGKVEVKDAAKAQAAGITEGISEESGAAQEATAELVGVAADAVLNGEAEMAYTNAGKALVQYMIKGLQSKKEQVSAAMKQVITNAASSAKNVAQSQGQNTGYYFDVGLASGIRNNSSLVYDAAYAVAAEASRAAKAAIDVNSPSKVAMEIGGYFSEGMAIGIRNNQKMVADASAAMANAAAISARGTTQTAVTNNNTSYGGNTFDIVINGAGGNPNDIANAVMDKINSTLIRSRGGRR